MELRNNNGSILYSIAYEDWKNRKTGFAYLHAKDRGDAMATVITAKDMFPSGCRIVSIAPVIGVMEQIKRSIRVFGGI